MIIHHHLGLGDHFICYGILRHIAEQEIVTVLCKENNYETVRDMYRDTNVRAESIESDEQAAKFYPTSKKIGFTSECETEEEFGREFYRQAGLPYETRWKYDLPTTNNQINRGLCQEPECRVIIADSPDYPINIEKGSFTRITNVGSMLKWRYLLENAEEIHCIESSVKQFVEFLNPKGKLFLHKFKDKSWRVVPSKHNWTIIEK